MVKVWTCEEAGSGLDAYTRDVLQGEEATTLMDHLLRCPSCLMGVWLPFVEQSARDAEDFLDEVLAPEGAGLADLPLSTQGGSGSFAMPNLAGPDALQGEEGPWIKLPVGDTPGLRSVGMVLPRVPRDEILSGYHLYLGAGAPRPLRSTTSVVKLKVSTAEGNVRVVVEGIGQGVAVDGIPLGIGQLRTLNWAHVITCPLWHYTYEAPREGAGWEGVGTLLYSGAWYPLNSARLVVGRDTTPGTLTLRDVPTQSNLEWRPGALEKQSREERRKLELLNLDSYKVSRHHAELRRTASGVTMVGLKEFEVVRIRRGGEVVSSSRGNPALDLLPGDLLKIGHQLFTFQAR